MPAIDTHLFRLQLLTYSVHIHVKRDNSFIWSPFSLGKYWPQRKRWWAWHPREPRNPWPPWPQRPPWTWRGECGTWGQGIRVENNKCDFSHIVSLLDGLSSQSIRVEIRWIDTMQQSAFFIREMNYNRFFSCKIQYIVSSNLLYTCRTLLLIQGPLRIVTHFDRLTMEKVCWTFLLKGNLAW